MNRRTFMKMACVATGAIAFGVGSRYAFASHDNLTNCGILEFQPYVTSPLIVNPFIDELPQPKAMVPGWRRVDGTLDPLAADAWTVRGATFLNTGDLTTPGIVVPGPGLHQQDIYGQRAAGSLLPDGREVPVDHAGTHQIWPAPGLGPNAANFNRLINWPAAGVDPILYHIRYQVAQHKFTTSKVRPIDSLGNAVPLPAGAPVQLDADGLATLPDSVIYSMNGTFPGPMINMEYGKPALVRYENDLDINPLNLDRQDFGAPDFAVLTHQHNGHVAPESDGQPHYMQINHGGYVPGDWVDSLYLMYPAGGDPAEKQSFLWIHDHREHHTGANVYKGQVGLTPFYDTMPEPGFPDGRDPGDETKGLRLPGVKVLDPDDPTGVTFNVKYDIPMALYDCALDDGVTLHLDMHTPLTDCPPPNGVGPKAHPEWWGKTFFKHWPNHGFVGDIFTVNGVAFPVLHVFKRRYRFRFLDASVSRIYELALMTSADGPVAMPGTQGQWQIPDGVRWNPWTWIANMGGLLPTPQVTDTFHIWPASRREFVVDFKDAQVGDVIYITNVLEMEDGRKPNFEPGKAVNNRAYKVPLVKIIVDGPPPETDQSVMPVPGDVLRPMPVIPDAAGMAALPHKMFELTRGGSAEEEQWVINKRPFDPLVPLATVVIGQPEVWTNKNGGGGWVHPMHMHMEEHTTLARVGSTLRAHPEDTGKEDVTNLEPGESVTFYRNFRTFTGRYVAHCHNLAHEDHNMMFGWSILGAAPAGGFSISGIVTDKRRKPLEGVTMTLAGASIATTTTMADGTYSFAGLAAGRYTVTPSNGGMRFNPPKRNVRVKRASVARMDFRAR